MRQIGICFLLVHFLITSAFANEFLPLGVRHSRGVDLYPVAGVIRNKGDGFKWIEHDGHKSINVDSVNIETNNEYVNIFFSKRFEFVGSLIVGCDEIMASKGIFVGASVSYDGAKIFFYQAFFDPKDMKMKMIRANPKELVWPLSNIWVSGWFLEESNIE